MGFEVNDSVTNHGYCFFYSKSPVITVHITYALSQISNVSSSPSATAVLLHRVMLLVVNLTTRSDASTTIVVLQRLRTTFVVLCFTFQLDPDFKEQIFLKRDS